MIDRRIFPWLAVALFALGLIELARSMFDAGATRSLIGVDRLALLAPKERRASETREGAQAHSLGPLSALIGHVPEPERRAKPAVARTVEPDVATVAKPIVADWIRFIGSAVGEDGAKVFFFKDAKDGRVLSLVVGVRSADGWLLESADASSFLLERSGDRFIVSGGGK